MTFTFINEAQGNPYELSILICQIAYDMNFVCNRFSCHPYEIGTADWLPLAIFLLKN